MWKEVDNVVVKGGPGKESLVTTPVRTKIKRWEIVAGIAGKVVRSGGKGTWWSMESVLLMSKGGEE